MTPEQVLSYPARVLSQAQRESCFERVGLEKAVRLMGPAGTIHAHNCRSVRGSARNDSDWGRPLLSLLKKKR